MSSLAEIFHNDKIWLQDVTKAYIQEHELHRKLFVKLAERLELPQDTYLKVLETLYGLSESVDSWSHKYKDVLKNQLKIQTADSDFSFHCKKDNDGHLKWTIAVYVDDTLAAGDPNFKHNTETISKTFESITIIPAICIYCNYSQ